MAVLETNRDELDPEIIEIPDKLVDILQALSDYCDKQTPPNANGCEECPFYLNSYNNCRISDEGYGVPHNWAVYY